MRMGMLPAAVCVASFLMAAPVLADAAKDIGNWSTSCTSGLTCSLTYEDGEERTFGTIAIIRTGAINAEIELRLPKPPKFFRNLDPNGAFRLSVDGRRVLSLSVRQLAFDPGRDEFMITDQASVRILLDAMKAGGVLRLDYEGVVGKHASVMKLEGFRGSLFYIDDVQDRRGRTDALFAVGPRVPEGLGSKDILSLDDIPAAIRADFTAPDGNCAEAFYPEDIVRYSGFDISRSGVRLVLVPCSSGGAYNQPYALYRGYESGALSRISFPDVEEGKPSISETADNVDFDPVMGIMTAFTKDIGLGYCGQWHKWRVTTGGDLLLLERRGWYECDGSRTEAEDFPLEWPLDGQPEEKTPPSTEE